MNSAFRKLGEVLHATPLAMPRFPVVCNVDARPVHEPEEIRQTLQDQVTGTVRWTETIEYLVDEQKCELFLELGPGGVLAGLLNRTRKGTPCLSVSDVAGVEAAAAALRE
jgi:[acyl-carrier-protein] S-malonyltransferase